MARLKEYYSKEVAPNHKKKRNESWLDAFYE